MQDSLLVLNKNIITATLYCTSVSSVCLLRGVNRWYKYNRKFQTWWTKKYSMISKGDKAVCVLHFGTAETNHKSVYQKSEPKQKKKLSASAIKASDVQIYD